MLFTLLACGLITLGLLFFVLASYGMFRLEDDLCRLHALSKIDNLALGFILLGVALLHQSGFMALQLFAIWLFCLITSAVSGYLLAQTLKREERQ